MSVDRYGFFFEHIEIKELLEMTKLNVEELSERRGKDMSKFSHVTSCLVVYGDGGFYAEALCKHGDVFSRSAGRKIALTRALKELFSGKENKELRTRIWKAYFEKVKK
jgi:hypothetical protein